MKTNSFFILIFILCVIIAGLFLLTQDNLFLPAQMGSPSSITNENVSPLAIQNSTYWVIIDPIPDHHPGDLIAVTGSTNVPKNENLTVEVLNYVFSPGCGGPHTICNDAYFSNTSQITLNASGNNTFAFTVNTSGFYQSKFRVRVLSARYDVMGESAFTLKQ